MSKSRKEYDAKLSALKTRMSRRLFLVRTGQTLVLAGGAYAIGMQSLIPPVAEASSRRLFSPEEFLILSAFQDHILPSEPDSPGARDIKAAEYVNNALQGSDVDPSDADDIKGGLETLETMSRKRFGKPFVTLPAEKRETVLREFEEAEGGEYWLILTIGYTLEAYVGDPAYGGNPDGIVWKWLGHNPGFPRPKRITAENRR
jgi:gluconate 2-dehydrogenase gamma chain